MKVKDLISELQKYDENLGVGIGNIEDDTDQAITGLEISAISKIERFDEFENRPLGDYFLAIGYKCSVCHRDE